MGYAIRAGAVHSDDCWKNIFPHDSPIYLRHRWLQVPITDSVCWVFLNPHPLTHTHTIIISRNHAQYRWNFVCETILLVERTYITDMHTLQCSGRTSKQLTEANESGLFIHQQNMYWRPSNEMSAGLMMPAYYLTVNTNDPLHSVSVRPPSPRKFHDHTHTPCLTQIDG